MLRAFTPWLQARIFKCLGYIIFLRLLKMKILILLSFISGALFGCGGSGTDSTTKPSLLFFDGIYANNDAFMLVDTELMKGMYEMNGMIGSNGENILSFDGFTQSDNSMVFKGSKRWSNQSFYQDEKQSMTALFSNDHVQTITNDFTHHLLRQPASVELSKLVGTHMTSGGQITEIREEGQFTSYGNALGCTYEGKLKMIKGLYYFSTVKVTACINPLMDGFYNGYFFTLKEANNINLFAIFHHRNHAIWGAMPITP